MPSVYRQPSPLRSIPRSAFEADALLGARRSRRIDAHTRLERTARGEVLVLHTLDRNEGPEPIITYHPSGDITVRPMWAARIEEFRRIAAVVPEPWSAYWRTHRRPQFRYRGVYDLSWRRTTFHSTGDISVGGGGRMTLAELEDEANAREGVTPLRSRRRTPRPFPRWAVRTDFPSPLDLFDTPVPPRTTSACDRRRSA